MISIASINTTTYFASSANCNIVFFSTAIIIIICITTIYRIANCAFTNLYAISLTTCVAFSAIYISSTALDNPNSIAFATTFYSNTASNICGYYATTIDCYFIVFAVTFKRITTKNTFFHCTVSINGNMVFFSIAICLTTIYSFIDGTVANHYIVFLAACDTFTAIYYPVYFAINFNDNMVFYSVCSTGTTTTHNIPQSITANRYSILSDITIKRICTTYDVSCNSTGNSNIVFKDFRRRNLCIIITTVNSIIITRVQRNISTC